MRRKWRRFVVARHGHTGFKQKQKAWAQWTAKMLHIAGGFPLVAFLPLKPSLVFGAAAIHKRGRLILVPRVASSSPAFWFLFFFFFGFSVFWALSFSCDSTTKTTATAFGALALALRLGKWPAALRLNFKLWSSSEFAMAAPEYCHIDGRSAHEWTKRSLGMRHH